MNTMLIKLYVKFQELMNREEGQDLVEYASGCCPDRLRRHRRHEGSGRRPQHGIHQHQHGTGQLHGLTSCEAGWGLTDQHVLLLRGENYSTPDMGRWSQLSPKWGANTSKFPRGFDMNPELQKSSNDYAP